MIYLDNSATTFPKPKEVYDALDYANRNLAFNAGRGNYKESSRAEKIIDDCRRAILELSSGGKKDVAFLSSATEALNIIISGLELNKGDVVYITPFEHNAIVRPLFALKEAKQIEIIQLPFDKETWNPDFVKVDEMFSIKRPKAVFVSHVSNVLGLTVPYEEIFELAKKYNSITVLDAAQSYGVIKPDLRNADFCVFAGHKSLYASFGIAGIIGDNFGLLKISKSGGTGSDSLNHFMPENGHERIESGSPNIVAIYGLSESIKWLRKHDIQKKEKELTNYLINSLRKNEKVLLYTPDSINNVFGIVSFNVVGYLSEEVASILYDEFGIAVRSGYHCSPFVHEFIDSLSYKGTIRISLGAFNTESDVEALVRALETL